MGIVACNRWAILGEGLWSLLDEAVGAFVLLEADGRIVDCNSAAEATFGWSREEAVGGDIAELLAPEDLRAECRAAMNRVVASAAARPGGQLIELRAMHRSGREVPIELVRR
jgi:PAS domain S-box-containing protein